MTDNLLQALCNAEIRIVKCLKDNKFYLQVGSQNNFLRRELTADELIQLSRDAQWWDRDTL